MIIQLKPIFSCAIILLWCNIGVKELQAQTGEEKPEAPNFSIFDEDIMSTENNDSQNSVPSNDMYAQGKSVLHPETEGVTGNQEKKEKKKNPFEWWDQA